MKSRRCYNDVWYFNLETLEYKFYIPSGSMVDARTAHSAVVYKNTMIVLGGTNINGTSLSDFISLDLDKKVWKDITNA